MAVAAAAAVPAVLPTFALHRDGSPDLTDPAVISGLPPDLRVQIADIDHVLVIRPRPASAGAMSLVLQPRILRLHGREVWMWILAQQLFISSKPGFRTSVVQSMQCQSLDCVNTSDVLIILVY